MRPFLKWAGGKSQLLEQFAARLPEPVKQSKQIPRYLEPFVGGGAMFFYLKSNFRIDQAYLFDINPDLILCYQVIKQNPQALLKRLEQISADFARKNEEERKAFYYETRAFFNRQAKAINRQAYNEAWVERASLLIFLNKTCYNGLFRLNKKGEFNVPYGRYKKPKFFDHDNLIRIHQALQNTEIICGDFSMADCYVTKDCFIYLDPPYRPLNQTSNFTSYAKDGFSDRDQQRLAAHFRVWDQKGAALMLSNSDPQNEDPDDHFFEELYKGYRIERVPAKRYINCDAQKRNAINELIIRNY